MRKILVVLIAFGLGVLICTGVYKSISKEDMGIDDSIESTVISPGSIAMMLETGVSTNQYSYSNEWPDDSEYTFNSEASKCENGSTLSWDSDTNQVIMTGRSTDKCYAYFDRVAIALEFDYTGDEQTYTVERTGYYQLEVWGASGGYGAWGSSAYRYGGYGSYSVGTIYLEEGDILYINIGGEGGQYSGGYNGGGSGGRYSSGEYSGGGGGATHIALVSGLLSTLESNVDDILIVAGAGGGGSTCSDIYGYTTGVFGGSGGGFAGGNTHDNSTIGATQSEYGYIISFSKSYTGNVTVSHYGTSGSFGSGGSGGTTSASLCQSKAGGGGGFYGGAGSNFGGSGGSGYIGNELLTDKVMYCYLCEESDEESTYTITTSKYSTDAVSKYAKKGNGYAKISYIGE